jgi:hypothetical protein
MGAGIGIKLFFGTVVKLIIAFLIDKKTKALNKKSNKNFID